MRTGREETGIVGKEERRQKWEVRCTYRNVTMKPPVWYIHCLYNPPNKWEHYMKIKDVSQNFQLKGDETDSVVS